MPSGTFFICQLQIRLLTFQLEGLENCKASLSPLLEGPLHDKLNLFRMRASDKTAEVSAGRS